LDSIDHGVLQSLLARLFKEPRLLDLLGRIIEHAPPGAACGKGVPIGNLTSQHFANLYLGELDHHLKQRLRIKAYQRYMDDGLVFADDKPTLHLWLAEIRQFLTDALQLELKERATCIAPVSEGIPYLGFQVYPQIIRLNRRTLRRFRRRIQYRENAHQTACLDIGELRTSGASLYAHIAHADTLRLRRQMAALSLHQG
jgi:hypothetical protein